MSIKDEMDKIKPQKLASDLPNEFDAEVLSVKRDVKKGQYAGAPLVKLEFRLSDGDECSTTYRIPKAWTGKGQLDMLKECLSKLGLELTEIEGKTFHWKRLPLTGAVTGNDRHYPIKQLKQTKIKGATT